MYILLHIGGTYSSKFVAPVPANELFTFSFHFHFPEQSSSENFNSVESELVWGLWAEACSISRQTHLSSFFRIKKKAYLISN